MNRKQFIEILESKEINYRIENDVLVVSHQGNVDLRSLTTMPENIKFENQGYVDLRSLTTMPENIKFENQGYVDLESLTTMPENIKFENQGYVYLESLTTMPENIKFENQGNVDLRSLTGKHTYLGKEIDIKQIDGKTMIIESSKKLGDFIVHRARYFQGKPIKEMDKCFVAEKGELYAHGKTVKQAIKDVNFKFLQANFNLDELVAEIKQKKTVSTSEYRLLTGACQMGVDQFMSENNITKDELPLTQVLDLVKNSFGGEKMQELFA